MNLTPTEAGIVRRLLSGDVPGAHPPDAVAEFTFLLRLNEEAPPLGDHVFRLECVLGTDAAKEIAANTKERKKLREALGKTRLGKGEGPARVVPRAAPTLNEYNAMDPWRKEALRAAFDKEIENLKARWPAWSCGATERSVPRPGKSKKCPTCKGQQAITRKRKEGLVRVPCEDCAATGKVGADPQIVREGGRRRVVVVTRESSVRPDELSIDAHLGGKIPLDRIVQAGVLRGDSHKWLVRYGTWKEAPPGEGRVVIDVYEIGAC